MDLLMVSLKKMGEMCTCYFHQLHINIELWAMNICGIIRVTIICPVFWLLSIMCFLGENIAVDQQSQER